MSKKKNWVFWYTFGENVRCISRYDACWNSLSSGNNPSKWPRSTIEVNQYLLKMIRRYEQPKLISGWSASYLCVKVWLIMRKYSHSQNFGNWPSTSRSHSSLRCTLSYPHCYNFHNHKIYLWSRNRLST